jgi:hypothetical protein
VLIPSAEDESGVQVEHIPKLDKTSLNECSSNIPALQSQKADTPVQVRLKISLPAKCSSAEALWHGEASKPVPDVTVLRTQLLAGPPLLQ